MTAFWAEVLAQQLTNSLEIMYDTLQPIWTWLAVDEPAADWVMNGTARQINT